MSDRILLKPKFGRRVRHAGGALFAEGGDRVELNAFYRRLIADGDLVAAATSKARPKKRTSR